MQKEKPSGKRFQRRVEDFVCRNCGTRVSGDGFTNHCPKCLFSLHVDMYPGDRKARCGGLMEPIHVEKEGERWKITHRCTVCGWVKKNKREKEDNFEALLALAEKN